MRIRKLLVLLSIIAFVSGCSSTPSLGYKGKFPSGYRVQRSESGHEPFRGDSAVGPRNKDNTFSSGIFAFVEPDAAHGGTWGNENQKAEHDLAVLSQFDTANFDPNYQLIEDRTVTVDGVTGRSLTFEQNMWLPHIPADKLPVRIKERSLYLKRDTQIWTITFLADFREWPARQIEFDMFLSSFRFDP